MKSPLQELAEKEDYNGILPNDVKTVIESMYAAASIFTLPELDSYIAALERGHAIAPILDPTAYMLGSKNLDDNIKAARIISKFKSDVLELKYGGQ